MIFPPAIIERPDELLADAQRMLDDETQALYADPAMRPSCGPLCNTCCKHAIIVSEAELRAVGAAVAELSPAIRATIAARLAAVRSRLAAEGLAEAANGSTFSEDFARRYFALGEPCPLLVDGACAVREVRPLTCREYLVASAPESCAAPSQGQVLQIKRRRPVHRNFVRVSAAFDEPGLRLLAVALDDVSEAPEPTPRSGPKMARLLLSGW